jgi:hypothetical protein
MRSIAATTSTTLSISWWVLGAVAVGLVIVAVAAGGLARRRVTVRLAGALAGPPVRVYRGPSGEALPLYLRVRLTRLSRRRSASDIALHLYAIADIRLHLVRYGPLQELTSREVKKAKGGSRSLQVSGVTIDKWEPVPFEDMEVWTTVPTVPGKYLGWTTSFEQGGVGGSGVCRFVSRCGATASPCARSATWVRGGCGHSAGSSRPIRTICRVFGRWGRPIGSGPPIS